MKKIIISFLFVCMLALTACAPGSAGSSSDANQVAADSSGAPAEHPGPTTGEAKKALQLDVQRLDTEVGKQLRAFKAHYAIAQNLKTLKVTAYAIRTRACDGLLLLRQAHDDEHSVTGAHDGLLFERSSESETKIRLGR